MRDQFSAAAEKNHRPAAQVIRDLMRDYVAQNDAVAAFSRISESERAKRQRNFAQAQAIVDLEGFPPSPEFDAKAKRYINGEITLAELTSIETEQIA
ncbi:MAG: antitoxin VbhA family protein [Zoogloeaceae bacterium]|nr:antitoxin VbhA family protein [Zoogloeaceae bacterium]